MKVSFFAVFFIVLFAALSLSVQSVHDATWPKEGNRSGSEQRQHLQQEAAAQTARILGDDKTNDPGEMGAVALVAATDDPDEAAAVGAVTAAGVLRNEPAALPPAAPFPAAPVPSASTRHMCKTRASNDRRQKEEQEAQDIVARVAQEPAVENESTVFPPSEPFCLYKTRAPIDRGAAATPVFFYLAADRSNHRKNKHETEGTNAFQGFIPIVALFTTHPHLPT